MTLENTFNRFRDQLRTLGSPLSNFKNFGNAWMIFRAIALVIEEQNVSLQMARRSFNISTAVGEDLDNRALEVFGLTRNLGTVSTGFLLVSSSTSGVANLPEGTLFTTLNSSVQLQTTKDYTINTNLEIPIAVKSLSPGIDKNLNSGTVLTSDSNLSLTAEVGRYRDPITREPITALSGGTDPETDEELRTRLRKTFGSSNYIQLENIIRGAIPEVSKVYVIENTPVAGYITVYINNFEARVLQDVSELVDRFKAAGIAFLVSPIKTLPVDVTLSVRLNSLSDSQNTSLLIKQAITNFFNRLEVGEVLDKGALEASVYQVNNVISSRVLGPSTNITTTSDQVVELGNLNISLEVR